MAAHQARASWPRRTAQLVAITDEFEDLKKELGVQHGLLNENERMQARAQIDAAVAKLYGLTKEEFAHVLQQFPNADERQKRMALEEY
ncbi:hypothetical protein HY095_01370 [Candidatus Micrarchaeota archaeon]|nr:hypothetical protein [Candidatus Micrarchaeota archaeon]